VIYLPAPSQQLRLPTKPQQATAALVTVQQPKVVQPTAPVSDAPQLVAQVAVPQPAPPVTVQQPLYVLSGRPPPAPSAYVPLANNPTQ